MSPPAVAPQRLTPIALLLLTTLASGLPLAARQGPSAPAPPLAELLAEEPDLPSFDSPEAALAAVERGIKRYYMNSNVRWGAVILGEMECRWPDECYYGDIDLLPCPHSFDRSCRPKWSRTEERQRFLDLTRAAAVAAPEDPFVVGQAVYGHAKVGRYARAAEIVWDCRLERWRCAALDGYVRYRAGQRDAGAERLAAAFDAAPDTISCRLRDIEYLLPEEAREAYRNADCPTRRATEERAWWLADPVWIDEENDRRSENRFRRIDIELHEQLWSLGEEPIVVYYPPQALFPYYFFPHLDWREYRAFDGHQAHHDLDEALGGHHRGVQAIGWPDSWVHRESLPSAGGRHEHWNQWVSTDRARYRFFPSASALAHPTGIDEDEWDFEPGDGWERYTPPYGSFDRSVDAQFARFARDGEMELAVGTELDAEWGELPHIGGLVLQPAWDAEKTVLLSTETRETHRFRARLPAAATVASLEIVGEERVSRLRRGVAPLPDPVDGVSASDLLLFRPRSREIAGTLEAAVSQMIGGETLDRGDEAGVFFEIYGLAPGESVELTLAFRQPEPGAIGGLFRSLGIGERSAPELSWTETQVDEQPLLARGLSLDLGAIEAGDWIVELSVTTPEGATLTRERRVTVEEGAGR